MIARLISAKAAIVVGSLVVGAGAAAAAAATSSSGADLGSSHAGSHVRLTTASSKGQPAIRVGANAFGLCTAYGAVSKNFTDTSNPALTHSSAFKALEAAATAQGKSVQTYCAAVTARRSTTTTMTSTTAVAGAPTSTSSGPRIGANAFGLCTAYAAVSKNFTDTSNPALTHSSAFRALEAAATGQGKSVQAYCAGVQPRSGGRPGSDEHRQAQHGASGSRSAGHSGSPHSHGHGHGHGKQGTATSHASSDSNPHANGHDHGSDARSASTPGL